MEQIKDWFTQPAHSFDLSIGGYQPTVKKINVVYRYNNHIVASESIEEAAKQLSEYFDFTVYDDEIEVLGEGVIKYEY